MDKLISVGQAAKLLECTSEELRNYEKEFDLKVPRTPNNRRMYSSREIESIRAIRKLMAKGLTNDQIRAIRKSQRVENFTDLIDDDVQDLQQDGLPTDEPISIDTEDPDDEIIDTTTSTRLIFVSDKDNLPMDKSKSTNKKTNPSTPEEEIPIRNADLISIFNIIAELRDEINELKNADVRRDNAELIEENARLKAKIKEKTYELVDVRERLNQLSLKQHKKSFFNKL